CSSYALLDPHILSYTSRDHRALHSFPTRRSSDLGRADVSLSPPLRVLLESPRLRAPRSRGRHRDLAARLPRGGGARRGPAQPDRSEEHTSELQSLTNLVCRLLLEKNTNQRTTTNN